jgi:5-methylcytosine-specific restriction protein A
MKGYKQIIFRFDRTLGVVISANLVIAPYPQGRPQMVSTDHFRHGLRAQFARASARGWPHIRINAGELHRLLGGYPGSDHGMEPCRDAMKAEIQPGDNQLLENGGSGLTISYRLPRDA